MMFDLKNPGFAITRRFRIFTVILFLSTSESAYGVAERGDENSDVGEYVDFLNLRFRVFLYFIISYDVTCFV